MTQPTPNSAQKSASYGAWRSPISAAQLTAATIGLQDLTLNGDNAYWIESRPTEAGRSVVVQRDPHGVITDRTPAPFNTRTRVHEYGGAAYTVHRNTLFFSNFTDQRIYRQTPNDTPQPITPDQPARYADLTIDPHHDRIICVSEDHHPQHNSTEPINRLTAIALDKRTPPRTLVEGNDFYAAPRPSPTGDQLAWITWNHPNMPWDGTQLWLARVDADAAITNARQIAGGPNEAITHPAWSPDGILHFVSDRTGWGNLYRVTADDEVQPILKIDAQREAELSDPAWVFGLSTYAFASPDRIIAAIAQNGTRRLAQIDIPNGDLTVIDTPSTDLRYLRATPTHVYFIGGSPTEAPAVVRRDLTSRQTTVLKRSSETTLDPNELSPPQTIAFPSTNSATAHAFYYPPHNPRHSAPAGERPPLIVRSHGGPTTASTNTLNLRNQYWTSRGFAVVDVNYGGSTGYGRAYRERLNGQWGVVDVDDCVAAATYLAERGDVDAQRLIITGGSAGGYTTLCALTFRDRFAAGAAYYGVSDAESLARDTHKFEARYLDSLIGPYPQAADLYRDRSPVHAADQLACPVIFFQGLEDEIVPPSQTETMVDALRNRGIPVAYLPFKGEQHGFRQAPNIRRALEAELYFYSRIFDIDLPNPIDPVPIHNLDEPNPNEPNPNEHSPAR